MIVRTDLILLLALLCSPIASAQPPYQWPLAENYGVTGTFAEHRGNHFHAGIDLSTRGKTGLPVFAVDDGVVHRMKVQKRGYGRALYILHADGLESVYAHLDRYSDHLGLERIYQKEVQAQRTKYPGDIFLEPPLAVKKGDVVAYSGESGAGLPHLHFEMRRDNIIAVNPLSILRDTQDAASPVFQAAYLYPLTYDSAIDGKMQTGTIRLRKQEFQYVGEKTPVVRGDFLASVSVFDPAVRNYRRLPHRIVYSIDERVVYSLEFAEFSFAEQYGFGLIYDRGKPGPSYYEYPVILNQLASIAVPFVKTFVRLSTKALSPGYHRLKIEATDANENSSVANIDFIVNDPPQFEFQSIAADGEQLIVRAAVKDPNWKPGTLMGLAAEVEYSADRGKTYSSFPMTTFDIESSIEYASFTFTVPLLELRAKTKAPILLRARGFDGAEYSPYAFAELASLSPLVLQADGRPPAGVLEYAPYGSAVRVIYRTDPASKEAVSLSLGPGLAPVPLQRREPAVYETVLPAPPATGFLEVSTQGGEQKLQIPIHYFQANSNHQLKGENWKIDFAAGTFFWDTFVWPENIDEPDSKSLPFIGPGIRLGPRGLPLQKAAVLSFYYPSNLTKPERLGVYAFDRARQRWSPIFSSLVKDERRVDAGIDYFDSYALIYDNISPSITPIFPKRNSATRNRTPRLAALVRDRGLGIDDELVFFYIDGIAYKADYDPDRDLATVDIVKPLRRGAHRCKIVAFDYGGNKVEYSTTFRVR